MTIAQFTVDGLTPSPTMTLQLGERLTLLTGDNSLGKTLLLDALFWALSGDWVDLPVYPAPNRAVPPQIALTTLNGQTKHHAYRFDPNSYDWPLRHLADSAETLALYARADGSFAIWDPLKATQQVAPALKGTPRGYLAWRRMVHLSREQVFDGFSYRDEVDGKERTICNGLLRDWITWQYRPDQTLFHALLQTITRLAPPDAPVKGAGTPVRLPNDARELPTLQLPYGDTPLPLLPAGLRRIVALAYLFVWMGHEHRVLAELTKRPPLHTIVLLLDEVEAHLHPKWQRAILPALLNVTNALGEYSQPQFVMVTHAPLVLLSAEPFWDADRDRLYHLNLHETGEQAGTVTLEETPFVVYGDASRWLTSDLFELDQARSREAEVAIQQATALQLAATPASAEVQRVHADLARLLNPLDPFWPLWRYFAQQHGVKA